MNHLTYQEAIDAFLLEANKQFPGYSKVPSEDLSSCRMGGWIIKDTEDMFIGWSGHRGDIKVYDYIPQTSETVKEYRVK